MNRGRAYYFDYKLTVAEWEEEADQGGWLRVAEREEEADKSGWGGGVQVHPYAMDDESIEWWAQQQAKYFADNLRRAREYEQKREQRKSKPFWERWFGA